jgi:hypothetical protein
MPLPLGPETIAAAHHCYGQLTGQNLRLGFDRQRQWYEWLRAGFTLEDLRRVIGYLQREIREGRRNVGALKLSNLLRPDRFEEDLNIRQVRLQPPPRPPRPPAPPPPSLSAEERERQRLAWLEQLRQLKETLGSPAPPPTATQQSANPEAPSPAH